MLRWLPTSHVLPVDSILPAFPSVQCFYTLKGHFAEIVCLSFNPQSTVLATGSMVRRIAFADTELRGPEPLIPFVHFRTTWPSYGM